MSAQTVCRNCGGGLGKNALADLCPKCLLKLGLAAVLREEGEVEATASSPAAAQFTPPTPAQLAGVFPQVEILELIGSGGMGAVYKARQASLDRIVALKILRPDLVADRAFADRFLREGRTLGKLNHPNIVSIHDLGKSGGYFFILMEYVDGTTLRRLIHDGSVAPGNALRLVTEICEALQYAHDQGIVHRDVKPENILIDRRGRVKMADFGLAKVLGAAGPGDLTESRQVMGTYKYMAPEQLEGARDIDHRADIYSLGVVFYELLTGELPLGRFDPPSKRAGLDARLDEIVLRALEKEPRRRYQQAEEVKSKVETVSRGPEPPRPEPPRPEPQPARAPRPRFRPHAAAAKLGAMRRGIDDAILDFAAGASWSDAFPIRCLLLPLIALIAWGLIVDQDAFGPGILATFGLAGFALIAWAVRSWRSRRQPPPELDEYDEIDRRLRSLGSLLRNLGILVIASCVMFGMISHARFDLLSVIAVVLAAMYCAAGVSLMRLRRPSMLLVLAAAVPVTPAAILGIPLAITTLRFLARPKVREFFSEPSPEPITV